MRSADLYFVRQSDIAICMMLQYGNHVRDMRSQTKPVRCQRCVRSANRHSASAVTPRCSVRNPVGVERIQDHGPATSAERSPSRRHVQTSQVEPCTRMTRLAPMEPNIEPTSKMTLMPAYTAK